MKSLPKIALAGPKGGGKTWIMNEVGKRLEFKLQEFKFKKDLPPIVTLAFADPIYEMQLDLFDFMSQTGMHARQFNEWLKASDMDNKVHPIIGMSPRTFRQQFGTEFAQARNPNIWTNIMAEKIMSAEASESSGIILLDVRFPNEVDLIRNKEFHLMYVNSMDAEETDSHASESHYATIKEQSDTVVSTKAQANKAVDEVIHLLISYLEGETDAGLIVPKGKLN